MHDQMSIRNALMYFFYTIDGKYVPGRLAGKFVSAMGGANGNGQSIHAGLLHKICGLLGVSQQLVMREFAFRAMPVFSLSHAGLERSKTAQLTFHGYSYRVSNIHDFAGNIDVVLIG